MRNPPAHAVPAPRQQPKRGKKKRKKAARKPAGPVYKAPIVQRVTAALIDLLIGLVPGLFFIFLGQQAVAVIILMLYVLLRDGMMIPPLGHQSVGKKLVKLHVEVEASGSSKLDPVTSVKRNAIPGAGLALCLIVGLVTESWLIAAAIAAVAAGVELVLAAQDPNGLRYGDKLAGTKVLD